MPSYTAYSEVRLTQQSPLGLPCSGEEVVLQCTFSGTAAIWTFPGGEITLAPGSNEEITENFHARPVGVANGEFTSTLTFPAENGTVVICSNGDRSMDDTQRVTVQGTIVFLTLTRLSARCTVLCTNVSLLHVSTSGGVARRSFF